LDSDEMGDPDLIEYLIELKGDADVLTHSSPNRQLDQFVDNGFGCVLFNRRALECLSFNDCIGSHDTWYYREIKKHSEIKVKKTRGTRLLRHLDGSGTESFPHKLSVPNIG